MADRSRKPANRVPARRDEAPQIPARRPNRTRFDRVWEGVDIAVTRALAVATAVAVVRGQVTPEVVAALYATLLLLRIPRSNR
jgi:hypothetical protein